MTHDVCAIGNAIVDMIEPCTDAFLEREGIAKSAMTLIDRDRARHLTNVMENPHMASGGSAANTISGLVACGGRGAFIGKVSKDALGKVFHDDLVRQGAAFQTPYYTGGDLETARSHIFVTPDGERSMNTYLGSSTAFSVDDLDEALITGAKITYLEGYLFDKDAAKQAFYNAAAIARGANRLVAMTLSDAFCVERHHDDFRALINGHIDIVFANEAEMGVLMQTPDMHGAIAGLTERVGIVIVTRSEKPALIGTRTAMIEVPAIPVGRVVDATGAGDQFAAGFLYGLTQGWALETAGALGCRLASHVIQHVGPRLAQDPKPWLGELAA